MLRIASITALLLMAIALSGLVIRGTFFSVQPLVVITEFGAAALMLWARLTLGRRSFHAGANPTSGELVTTGPYRYIRHPIYSSICLFSCAGVLAYFSLVNLLLGILLIVGVLVRLFCEEHLLVKTYPEYRPYSHTNWRLLPFIF